MFLIILIEVLSLTVKLQIFLLLFAIVIDICARLIVYIRVAFITERILFVCLSIGIISRPSIIGISCLGTTLPQTIAYILGGIN